MLFWNIFRKVLIKKSRFFFGARFHLRFSKNGHWKNFAAKKLCLKILSGGGGTWVARVCISRGGGVRPPPKHTSDKLVAFSQAKMFSCFFSYKNLRSNFWSIDYIPIRSIDFL